MTSFICSVCARNIAIKPIVCGGTGYARDRNTDALVCYNCCAIRDLEDMKTGKKTLYLADGHVTNWCGTLKFPVNYKAALRHPFARSAVIAYFTGPDGHEWSGKNIGDNQIAHCRRLKHVNRTNVPVSYGIHAYDYESVSV